jgi:hypothetical protein
MGPRGFKVGYQSIFKNRDGFSLSSALIATAMIAGIAGTVGVLSVGQRSFQKNASNEGQCKEVVIGMINVLKSHDNALSSRSWFPQQNSLANVSLRIPPAALTSRLDPFNYTTGSPANRSTHLRDTKPLYVVDPGTGEIQIVNGRYDVNTSQNLRNLATWASNIYDNNRTSGICSTGLNLNRESYQALSPRAGELELPTWISQVNLKIEPIGRACGDVVPMRVGSNDSLKVTLTVSAAERKLASGLNSTTRIVCSDSTIAKYATDNEAAMLVPIRGSQPLRIDQYTRRATIGAYHPTCSGVVCDLGVRPDAFDDMCCWEPFRFSAGKCCASSIPQPGGGNGDCDDISIMVEAVSSEPGSIFACGSNPAGGVRYCGDFVLAAGVSSSLNLLKKDHSAPKGRSIASFDSKGNSAVGIVFRNIQANAPGPGSSASLYVKPIDIGRNVGSVNSGQALNLPTLDPACDPAHTSRYCSNQRVFDLLGNKVYNGCQPDCVPDGLGGCTNQLQRDLFQCFGTGVPSCGNCNLYPFGQPYVGTCGMACTGCGAACACPSAPLVATMCSSTMTNDSCGNPVCPGAASGTCDLAEAPLQCTGTNYNDSCGVNRCPGTLAPSCDPAVAATIPSGQAFTGTCGASCTGTMTITPATCPPGGFPTQAACRIGPESTLNCTQDAVSSCWFRPNCRFFTEHDCSWHDHVTGAHVGSNQFECVADANGCFVQANLCCRWATPGAVVNDCGVSPAQVGFDTPRNWQVGDPSVCYWPTVPGTCSNPTTYLTGSGAACAPTDALASGPGGAWTPCCTTFIHWGAPGGAPGFEASCMSHANETGGLIPSLVTQIPGVPVGSTFQTCAPPGGPGPSPTPSPTTSPNPCLGTPPPNTVNCGRTIHGANGAFCGVGTAGCPGQGGGGTTGGGTGGGTCDCNYWPHDVDCGVPIINTCGYQCGTGTRNCGGGGGGGGTTGNCQCADPSTIPCHEIRLNACGQACPAGTQACPPADPGSNCTASHQCAGPGDGCGGIPWEDRVGTCPAFPGEAIFQCQLNAGNDCFECVGRGACSDNRNYDPDVEDRYR